MQVRRYDHLLCRVEYPAERGYRMEPKQLPDWIHVTITEQGDSKFLTVHSRIHVNKEVKVGPSYSADLAIEIFLKTSVVKSAGCSYES